MVNLEPILSAPLAVRLHFATVVPAFVLGTWLLFFSRKGSPRHLDPMLCGKTAGHDFEPPLMAGPARRPGWARTWPIAR
jgi:hypothetical protein